MAPPQAFSASAYSQDAVARSDASALAGAWFAVTFNSRPDSRVVEMVSKGLESCGRTELASVVLQEAASNGVEGVGGGSGSEQES